MMESNGIIATEPMKQRSVLSEGNKSRLYSVIKRAARGEKITFSVIGGSITHGCLADSRRESYAELTCDWWRDKFPWTVVNYVNCGIGATDSYIGVHRAGRDLLTHDPDIVIVEFSVNDTDEMINPDSYRCLVKKILNHDSEPAVILLFMMDQKGSTFQKFHSEAGWLYDLPMISYADAIGPEIEAGKLKWENISPDDIHPSSAGHALVAELINSYMDKVFSETFSSEAEYYEIIESEDKYDNARFLDNRDINPVLCTGFWPSDISPQFPHSWSTTQEGRICFEVIARNIGIVFLRTIDSRSGTYSVRLDGKPCCNLDGDFTGGWGDYADYKEILVSDLLQTHYIEIEIADGSAHTGFTVLGLCLS